MSRKPYLLTDIAGTHVAGVRIRDADRARPLMLTDSQAEHELRMGTIAPAPKEPKPAPKAKA